MRSISLTWSVTRCSSCWFSLLRSLSSRAFSIAITAWSANALTSSICRSEKSPTSRRYKAIAPMGFRPATLAHRETSEYRGLFELRQACNRGSAATSRSEEVDAQEWRCPISRAGGLAASETFAARRRLLPGRDYGEPRRLIISPSKRNTTPYVAPHRCTELWAIVSKTGRRSVASCLYRAEPPKSLSAAPATRCGRAAR